MIRSTLLVLALLPICTAQAQITITESDMPVRGDKLRYSNATATGATFATDGGANMTWNYSLTATSQGIDEYKRPGEVNPLFGLTITDPTCYGYKIADSIPGIGLIASGITINNLHTFFNILSTPRCFAAEAFGATISGFPLGSMYTKPDAWYHFPLEYGDVDSTDFDLTFGAATFGSIQQKGYRKSTVDGWGTITTPYYTTPVNCIRVRSEINEIDSVSISGTTFGLPRTTIEYKYMTNVAHYPALWVTAISVGGLEINATTRYYDPLPANVPTTTTHHNEQVTAYPNPVQNGTVYFDMPAHWTQYVIELYDLCGKSVGNAINTNAMDMSKLPAGTYIARITAGSATAYVTISK